MVTQNGFIDGCFTTKSTSVICVVWMDVLSNHKYLQQAFCVLGTRDAECIHGHPALLGDLRGGLQTGGRGGQGCHHPHHQQLVRHNELQVPGPGAGQQVQEPAGYPVGAPGAGHVSHAQADGIHGEACIISSHFQSHPILTVM